MDTNAFISDITRFLSNIQPSTSICELVKLVALYENVLVDLIDKYAPIKTRLVINRPKAPWMNEEILKEKKIKRKCERKWRATKLPQDKEIFKVQKKKYDRLLRDAHTRYLSSLVIDNANDPKSLFKIINEFLNGKKKNKFPEHTSDETLAEDFSIHFCQKVAAIHTNLKGMKSYQDGTIIAEQRRYKTTLDCFREVTEEQIWAIIHESPKKSCCLDPFPTWLLITCKIAITPIIRSIINSSLSLYHVPESFKLAAIMPLLKQLNMELIYKNYRPVSNLKYISKLTERVVALQLNEHLVENDILEPMQSAYKSGHSTETALLKVQNDILMAMDNQKVTALLLLDLSAAFDTVNHTILLNRLQKRVGITGGALRWFQSYLENRKQSVRINNVNSEPVDLKYGVPQGSVLGPVLFSLYTLPLADVLKTHGVEYHLYADDTQIYMSFKAIHSEEMDSIQKLSACIAEVKKWMMDNFLQLNTDKTKFLIFGTRNQLAKTETASFDAAGDIVEISSSARNLGIIFDNSLSMNQHVSHLSRICFNDLRNISYIRKYLTLDATKTIVQALVCSRLDYCNSLYYGLPNTQIQRLQRIQNAAARIILKRKKFDHITPVLIELHWLPLKFRITFKLLLLTYKSLNGQAPPYLVRLLKPKTLSYHELRSNALLNNLEIRDAKLCSGGDRAFSIAAPREWNKLPANIKSSQSIEVFKSRLKTYLFRECFNTDI